MRGEVLTVLGVIFLGLNHGIMHAYLTTDNIASEGMPVFVNFVVPTVIDILMGCFLLYGIFNSEKALSAKLLISSILILLIVGELYYIYNKSKESTVKYNEIYSQLILFTSSLFKLYVLITLHCDVSSNISRNAINTSYDKVTKFFRKSVTPKPVPTPRPEPRSEPRLEQKPEADILKASQIFNDALKLSPLTTEEINETREKFNSGITEERPWDTLWNTFNNSVIQKIPEDVLTKEKKDELRNKFKIAMGKTPKVGGRR